MNALEDVRLLGGPGGFPAHRRFPEERSMPVNRREFGLVSLGLALSSGASPPEPPRATLLVPAYFYPRGEALKDWDRMIASASLAPITAIVNPSSGPGKSIDPRYVAVLKRAVEGKLALIGYVSTHYAERPLAEARADVDRWLAFYPQVGGFFFDEQASDNAKIDYYVDLASHARAALSGAKIVANPGTTCDEAYVARKTSDVVCLFENSRGFDAYRPPPWTSKYDPGRFAIIPYAIPQAEAMRRILKDAEDQRTGVVYVTDDSGANPYDRLPRYWDHEVKAVEAMNRR